MKVLASIYFLLLLAVPRLTVVTSLHDPCIRHVPDLAFITFLFCVAYNNLGTILGSLPVHLASPLISTSLAGSSIPVSTSWSSGAGTLPLPISHPWPWLPTVPPTSSSESSGLAPMAPRAPDGLILSPTMEPIPSKMVQRIQSGQFVEMRELLPDNVALCQHLESMHGHLPFHSLSGHTRPRFREISTPLSWINCFLTYLAVRTQDTATRDQLMYSRLVLQEAARHGGMGWIEYDRVFRKQAALNSMLTWNSLQPGLHASAILGQRSCNGVFCTLCKGTDHSVAQCALSYVHHPVTSQTLHPPNLRYRPQAQSLPRRPESLQRICISWNKGQCTFPGNCVFRHICETCQEQHKARECPSTPEDSHYRQVSRVLRPRSRPPPVTPAVAH